MTLDLDDLYIRSVEKYGVPPDCGHAAAIYHSKIDYGSHWHAMRAAGIGASEASAAMGLSRWTSPLQMFSRKLSGEADLGDYYTKRGHLLEPLGLEMFEAETGHPAASTKWRWRHPQRPWQQCELDGWTPADGGAPVEVKAPGEYVTDDMLRLMDGDQIEPTCEVASYVYQLHHQMMVTGARHGWLSVCARGPMVVRVDWSDEIGAAVLDAEERMWACVLAGIAPLPSHHDLDDIRAAWHTDQGEREIAPGADQELAQMIADFDDVDQHRAELERELKDAKRVASDARALVEARASRYAAKKLWIEVDGQRRSVSVSARRGLDGGALKAAHPEIHKEFYVLGKASSTINKRKR